MKKKYPKTKNTVKSKTKKADKKTAKKTEPEAKKKLKTAKQATSKKKAVKTKEKPVTAKPKTTAEANKTAKKVVKKTETPAPKKVAAQSSSTKKTAITAKKTETMLPVKAKVKIPEEKMYPVFTRKTLPMEYGEDKVTLMTVDPWKLFAYWEIKKSTVSKIRGTLVIRVYDVTGISHFDGKNAGIVFDIPIFGRIGDSYIGAGPGRDFIIDIGIISQSKEFIMFARSNRVSTPALKVSEKEEAISKEIFEAAPRIGY